MPVVTHASESSVTPATPPRFPATRGVPSSPAGSGDVDPPGRSRALEDEDVERLGESIAELAARIQAATYQLLVLIREFDEGAGWQVGYPRPSALSTMRVVVKFT